MGNFVSTLQEAGSKKQEIEHGATILATGAQEYRGPEYGFGAHPNIITQQQLESVLSRQSSFVSGPHSVVMIQCVGPAEKFCSRICCIEALKNAIAKEQRPSAGRHSLQGHSRYGFKERLHKPPASRRYLHALRRQS
jgi:heterodisulfide reductase subunit A-like polyferredoxin